MKNFVPASFNWDSGTNRQLSVTLDISDFQKIHISYFEKNKKKGEFVSG